MRLLPDTNVWRYIVDEQAVDTMQKAAKAANVGLVACPAVVYECLRTPNADLRRRIARALTPCHLGASMPEAFVEPAQLRAELARLGPEWLVERSDLRNWRANRND